MAQGIALNWGTIPKLKIFFQFIIHQEHYIKFGGRHIENLDILLKNRRKDKIIFLSSNNFRIVAAMSQDFLSIPIAPYENLENDDI